MSENKVNRADILFYYDNINNNPNGDPLDENKPRVDPENGLNLVSDVRIKRTIRDYLFNYKGFRGENDKDILVRKVTKSDGTLQNMTERGKTYGKTIKEIGGNILKKCIDVRLFGGTITFKKGDGESKGASIMLTGPVQFNMLNKSKHKVSILPVGHSFTLSSTGKEQQGSWAPEYIVPYSLIEVNGIINENSAKTTNLSNKDIDLLMESLWNGTRNLITRSKFGQNPRLLIVVKYKEGQSHIGKLGNYVDLKTDKNEESIRGTKEFSLDITKLLQKLHEKEASIEAIKYKADPELKLLKDGKDANLGEYGKELVF